MAPGMIGLDRVLQHRDSGNGKKPRYRTSSDPWLFRPVGTRRTGPDRGASGVALPSGPGPSREWGHAAIGTRRRTRTLPVQAVRARGRPSEATASGLRRMVLRPRPADFAEVVDVGKHLEEGDFQVVEGEAVRVGSVDESGRCGVLLGRVRRPSQRIDGDLGRESERVCGGRSAKPVSREMPGLALNSGFGRLAVDLQRQRQYCRDFLWVCPPHVGGVHVELDGVPVRIGEVDALGHRVICGGCDRHSRRFEVLLGFA